MLNLDMNALTSCLVEFDYFIHVTLVQEGTESQLFCGCVVLGAGRYLLNLVLHLYQFFFFVFFLRYQKHPAY